MPVNETIDLAGHVAHRDQRRSGCRRREPSASGAVRSRRGSDVRPAARARRRGCARRVRSEPARRSFSTLPSSRCALRRTGAAHLDDAAREPRAAGRPYLYVPELFARDRRDCVPTNQIADGARRGAGVLMARPRRRRSGSLDALLAAKEIVVTCGSGGVGKTTTAAAAAAMAAAHHGGRVLVLTVDPARRLANALGLEAFGNVERRVRRRGVRGSRRRAARRAVGGDARHEAVVGRPRAPPRSRRRDT